VTRHFTVICYINCVLFDERVLVQCIERRVDGGVHECKQTATARGA
jgi:hypothetical protein